MEGVDFTLLSQFLTWLATGGGAGVATYWAMDLLERHTGLNGWTAEAKRYFSLFLAAAFASAAFVVAVELGYQPHPINAQMWAEGCFAVSAAAIGLSQVIHGRTQLRQPD